MNRSFSQVKQQGRDGGGGRGDGGAYKRDFTVHIL